MYTIEIVGGQVRDTSGKPVAGRIAAGLSGVYLVLLSVALLAMSGKWGS